MKRIDVMTDIETLGTSSDSTIFQISAVTFDIITGEIKSSFNKIANIELNEKMNVDGSTIKWWLNTNKDLLQELLNSGTGSSTELLVDFHKWLSGEKRQSDEFNLWGNGILFDNKMIQHQLESIGLNYPIKYKNDRDVRTIVDLASQKLGITERELKEKFVTGEVEHDAFNDVRYQVKLVSGCYGILVG